MKHLDEIKGALNTTASQLDDLRSDLMETLQETDVHPERDAEEFEAVRQEIQHCHTRLFSISSLLLH